MIYRNAKPLSYPKRPCRSGGYFGSSTTRAFRCPHEDNFPTQSDNIPLVNVQPVQSPLVPISYLKNKKRLSTGLSTAP